MVRDNDYIIVGGGPVGLLAAVLLSKEFKDARIIVFEARETPTINIEQSYPIGLNPRGVRALDRANRDLAIYLRSKGHIIDGWIICSGSRQVAELPSGLVIGTTRALINQTLLHELRRNHKGRVEVKWSHTLKAVDFLGRRLTFEHNGEELVIDGGTARFLACDGVNSIARSEAVTQFPDFKQRVDPWLVQFRLVFSKPGAKAAGLDPRLHYILNGIYVSIIQDDIWVIAVGISVNASPKDKELLLADSASQERVEALRQYVTKVAPLAAPLLTEENLQEYFSRKAFRGALVKVSRLNIGEWAVLLGDAAHSTIPATGEGFNSGAEDVEILMDALLRAPQAPFAAFSDMRLPDLHALHTLAYHLNISNFGSGPGKVVRSMTNIMVYMCKRLGLFRKTYEDMLFGVDAEPPQPYYDIIRKWRRQRIVLSTVAQCIVYPLYTAFQLTKLPQKLMQAASNS